MSRVRYMTIVTEPTITDRHLVAEAGVPWEVRLRDSVTPVTFYPAPTGAGGFPATVANLAVRNGNVEPTVTVGGELWVDSGTAWDEYTTVDGLAVSGGNPLLKVGANGALSPDLESRLPVNPETFGAVGDGVTDDSTSLETAFATGRDIALRPGAVYRHRRTLYMSTPGQKLDGKGATLKRAAQYVTTTNDTITAGVTNAITVADASGFRVGETIVVDKGVFFDPNGQTITAIVGNLITVAGFFGYHNNATTPFTDNTNTQAALVGPINVRHGWNQLIPYAADQRITNVILDGNSANWTFGRWQHTVALQTYSNAPHCRVDNCVVINQYGDGYTFAAVDSTLSNSRAENVKGRGFVFAGNTGDPTDQRNKVLYNDFVNCNLDPLVGGNDGIGSICFSQGGPSTLIIGNTIDGGVDGIGGVRSGHGSECTIAHNHFWNLTGKAINGNGSSPLDVRRVHIHDNHCYGSGISINRIGSTGNSIAWDIHDNTIIGVPSAAEPGALVLYNTPDVNCHDNHIYLDSLAPLTALQMGIAAVVGGGTFVAGTYYYVISAVNAAGETTASEELVVTVAANGQVKLTWDAVPGATGYRIYRATASGGQTAGNKLVAAIPSATTSRYTDTGAATTAGFVPAANTTKFTAVEGIVCGAVGGACSGKVHDNTIKGGQYGIRLNLNCSALMVESNTCKSQYKGGILNGSNANTDITIRTNYIVGDASALAGYQGISPLGTDEVANNTVNVTAAPATAYGIIANNSTGGMVIKGNKVRSTPNTPIQVNGTVTSCRVVNNDTDKYITDAGVTTVRFGNTYGAGPSTGQAVLVAGTKTVSALDIRAGDTVLLTNAGPAGTPGILSVGAIVNGPGGSFVINSTNAADTSTVNWQIVH